MTIWPTNKRKAEIDFDEISVLDTADKGFKIYWGENTLKDTKGSMDLMSKQSNSAKKWDL